MWQAFIRTYFKEPLNRSLVEMSFEIESFIAAPSVEALSALKRTELTQVTEHYKLSVTSAMKKGEICQLIVNYLHEEELISDEEVDLPGNSAIALK